MDETEGRKERDGEDESDAGENQENDGSKDESLAGENRENAGSEDESRGNEADENRAGRGQLQRVEVIAQLFGLSVRRIQQLVQEGVLKTVPDPDGGGRKFELVPTIQAYIKFLSEKAYGKNASEKEAELKNKKLEAEIALKESQGEIHRLKTDIASGKYISVEEASLDYEKFFVVFKKFALALPARAAGYISGYCEPAIVRSIERDINNEIKSMLRTFVLAARPAEENAGRKETGETDEKI